MLLRKKERTYVIKYQLCAQCAGDEHVDVGMLVGGASAGWVWGTLGISARGTVGVWAHWWVSVLAHWHWHIGVSGWARWHAGVGMLARGDVLACWGRQMGEFAHSRVGASGCIGMLAHVGAMAHMCVCMLAHWRIQVWCVGTLGCVEWHWWAGWQFVQA